MEQKLETFLTLCETLNYRRAAERRAMIDLARRLDPSDQWWHEYGEVTTAGFRSYLVLESLAETVRTYELRFIPGLLQIREYAESVFRAWHGDDEAAVENAVAVRLERQSLLNRAQTNENEQR